jgi:hypothetical protein
MPNILQIPSSELFALLAAIGFAAGLNLYATVAVLGLLARFGHMPLPPGLHLLAGWPVIGASLTLFAIEFFGDKIPAFDLVWNALHTFIRVPIAGLLAFQATSQLSPEKQLLATLLGAAVAFVAHGGKTAARAAVTWLATRHPYIAGVAAVILVAITLLLLRLVIRALRALFRGADHRLAS